MNMYYRLLLAIIDKISLQDAEFSARVLSQRIIEQLPSLSSSTNIKLISNDLNRLYRMQLLSRKKVKRPVGGGYEYRGFMYAYTLNKQGRSYVEYLKRTFFHPDFQEYMKKFSIRTNPHAVLALSEIERNIGQKIDDLDETYAEYLYLHSKPRKGRYGRFPTRISFEFVKELMERKHKLEQENERLKADLKVCKMQMQMLKRNTLF